MHIKSIEDASPSGDYSYWKVTFVHDAGEIIKSLMYGGCAKLVARNEQEIKQHRAYNCAKLIKEALRDVYYQDRPAELADVIAGKAQAYRPPFADMERLALEALALRPDLFAAPKD